MIIRQETVKDHEAVFRLVADAFKDEIYTDHKEQFLVARLRRSEAFVPELSLVATIDDRVVGYILLTRVAIVDDTAGETTALALAPLAVAKACRGQGIGGQLIQKAHEVARALQYGAVILLGHGKYYPKFGYEMARKYGISLPFDVPDEYCMLIELRPGALQQVSGRVVYPPAFYE